MNDFEWQADASTNEDILRDAQDYLNELVSSKGGMLTETDIMDALSKPRENVVIVNKPNANLREACDILSNALLVGEPQKIASAIALMYIRLGVYVDDGETVTYDDIDSELMAMEEKE